ncbi:MAG: lysozyme [Nocardioidaceae bacterium]
MTSTRKSVRRLLVAASAAALCAATLGTGAAAQAQGGGEQPGPTAQARAAGIQHRGQAQMGWRNGVDTQSTAPADALTAEPQVAQVYGIDVSGWQGNVNWQSWWDAGFRFAYVKATESTSYINGYFAQQYNGSYNVGMIRGAYHFATPNTSSGAAQANYFVDHGGGWSADGKTLPGALDIEYNPYGDTCYNMSAGQLRSWIADFVATYKARTGRDVVIYTARNWWVPCMNNSTQFSQTNPLWVADYQNTPPILFGGWPFYTFHQYSGSGTDKDTFNGSYDRLIALAMG